MSHDAISYYRHRAATERQMARTAGSTSIRQIHEELAQAYEAMVEQRERASGQTSGPTEARGPATSLPLLERAFELASSGDYRTVGELEKRLIRERYGAVAAHLSGPSIRKQLRELIAAHGSSRAPSGS